MRRNLSLASALLVVASATAVTPAFAQTDIARWNFTATVAGRH